LAALYLLSYVCLSIAGRYEPADWGLTGPKSYAWAPLGFFNSHDLRWRKYVLVFFFPLYAIDCKIWHTQNYPAKNQ
jgi:hypothetical protein